MSKQPHLAITLGDPAGIGTEIILKALADATIYQDCHLTVIGSKKVLQFTYEHLLEKQHLKKEY